MMNYKVVAKKNPTTKEVKYYAQLALTGPVKLASFADAISRQCTVTKHDVKAVISAMEEHLLRQLLDGKSVRLGDLGSFRPTFSSAGSEAADKVTADNIRSIRVRFCGSPTLRSGLKKANPELRFRRLK